MSSVSTAQQDSLRALTKTFVGLEKPLHDAKTPETLVDLIAELHRVFDDDHVNIEYVNHLLLSYKSNPSEWKKFAKFDRYRYTRNLVDAGNGKFNLMILCWGEGHGSAIHDHADSHCFMKMLKGELAEIRYAWPDGDGPAADVNESAGHIGGSTVTMTAADKSDNGNIDDDDDNSDDKEDQYNRDELQEMSRSSMELDGVCYINDSLGLHRVENPSHTDVAVSLHLYCPPFDSCSIFNKETGKRTSCNVTFWSKFGERRDKSATTKALPEDN